MKSSKQASRTSLHKFYAVPKRALSLGSGGGVGLVGRAVASDTRDWIQTSAKFYLPIVHLNRKDENKEKVAGNGPS